MRRQILLIRHAKAAGEPAGSDFDRPLTPSGQQDAQALAHWLTEQGIRCDGLYYSSAQRTSQSWQALQQGWQGAAQAVADESLYLASAGDLLDYLHKLPNEQSNVALVAHNPGLHQLGMLLTKPNHSASYEALELGFATCACLCLQLELKGWQDLAPQSAQLLHYWQPSFLG